MSTNEQIKHREHLNCAASIYTNFGQEHNSHPTSIVCYIYGFESSTHMYVTETFS
jgi:hypothetical protein